MTYHDMPFENPRIKTATLLCLGDLDCPYQRTDNGYPRYLDTIVDNVKDEVACEVQCTFYDQFVCRAFAYYASANQCFISGDDRGTVGHGFRVLVPNVCDWHYMLTHDVPLN